MNNASLYTPQSDGFQSSVGRTHLALMGDPSLRMKMIIPPTGLTITNASGVASFAWTASSESVLGYHVYQFNAGTGAITRLTSTPVTGSTYLNPAIPFVAGAQYMVRAVKLESNFSGSYHNLSLGSIGTAAGSPTVDCLGVSGGTALPGPSRAVPPQRPSGLPRSDKPCQRQVLDAGDQPIGCLKLRLQE